ncbi:unnamed protein product, partial [Symbiodinium sp. CCMP2456]
DNAAILECRNVIRPLPKSTSSWVVKYARGGIPFVTDGAQRLWCMSLFQDGGAGGSESSGSGAPPKPNLDLSSIQEAEEEESPRKAIAAKPFVQGVKGVVPAKPAPEEGTE